MKIICSWVKHYNSQIQWFQLYSVSGKWVTWKLIKMASNQEFIYLSLNRY